MPQKTSTVPVVTLFPFKDEYDLLRQYFAFQEGLSEKETDRVYSDSILLAARAADPNLYAVWVQEAHVAFERLKNA